MKGKGERNGGGKRGRENGEGKGGGKRGREKGEGNGGGILGKEKEREKVEENRVGKEEENR